MCSPGCPAGTPVHQLAPIQHQAQDSVDRCTTLLKWSLATVIGTSRMGVLKSGSCQAAPVLPQLALCAVLAELAVRRSLPAGRMGCAYTSEL